MPKPPLAFLSAFSAFSRRYVSASSTAVRAGGNDELRVGVGAGAVQQQMGEDLRRLAQRGFAGEERVRLALRGLEGDGGAVRVAVLGNCASVGRLLSLILADPLGEGEGGELGERVKEWCSTSLVGDKALLIRHGPPTEISRLSGSPLSVLTHPSPLLQDSSREILLASIPPSGSGSSDPTDLAIPTSNLSGAGVLRFPVHRCILWSGEGVSGVYSLLSHHHHHQHRPSSSQLRVLNLISLPGLSRNEPPPPEAGVGIVDLATAERAVRARKGAGGEAEFLKTWGESGMRYVTEWVSWGVKRKNGGAEEVKPAVKLLISAIISEAEGAIRRKEEKGEAESWGVVAAGGEADTAVALREGLRAWAERAHGELHKRLEEAWEMRLWRSLEWWKLLWTVDDVAGNAREVVEAGLLPDAKREFLLLAGRMAGAGYRGGGVTLPPTPTPEKEETAQADKLLQNLHETRGSNLSLPPPLPPLPPPLYPPHLFNSTSHVLESLIPTLQSSATTLLVQSLSTSLTSLAASALLYLSDIPAYSSCTVGAIGVMLSMRFLQTRWARVQRGFQEAVKEHGRVAVVECERWGWAVLLSGVPARDGNEEREAWDAAQRVRRGVEAL